MVLMSGSGNGDDDDDDGDDYDDVDDGDDDDGPASSFDEGRELDGLEVWLWQWR